MCELLGMSFNLSVRPSISFRGFRYRGENNPHGWGLAFYPDESVQIVKEPIKAKKSSLSKFLQDYQEVRSKVFVAHVRYTSVGSKSHKNTHPFYRELSGKEYVFAHNGTLKQPSNQLKSTVHPLLCKGYICQDSRDRVKWNHNHATFYTDPLKRGEIDRLIE